MSWGGCRVPRVRDRMQSTSTNGPAKEYGSFGGYVLHVVGRCGVKCEGVGKFMF